MKLSLIHIFDTPTKSTEKVVAKDTGDIFKFEADVEFTEGTRTFGVRFYEDEDKACLLYTS